MTIGAEAVQALPGADTVPAATRPRMTRRAPKPGTVLAVSAFGVFMAFVDATIVNVAFPDIRRSFPGTAFSDLSWVLNAYNIVFAAFLVAAGRIADLLGRRRMFVTGLVVFTVASGLCAIAGSAGALIALRVLQALGAACVVPASLAIVLEAYPAERRAHAVALLTAIGALAAGIGPSLGGVLVTASDWRLVFLVNVPIGIAAIVLTRRHIVESRAPGRRRMPDLPGAMLFAAAVALLVLAVVQGEEWGWASLRTLGGAGAAVALGAVFVWRCTWHRSPILDLGVLRDRPSAVANAMTLLAAAGFYGYTLANVLFLTSVWGYSVLETGLAITPGPFVAAAVAGPASRLAGRIGAAPVLLAGGVVWGGAVVWLVTRVGVRPEYVAEWLPGMVLLGVGAGILFPNLGAVAVAAAPGEGFATATALNSVARQVGAALGVAIVVAVIGVPSAAEAAAAFDRAWIFAAGCLFAAGIGSLAAGRVRLTGAVLDLPATAPTLLPAPHDPAAAPRKEALLRARAARPAPTADAVRRETVAEFLAGVPMFAGVAAPLREALGARARIVRVSAGEWLFRAGDAGDAMYLVRAGRMDVVGAAPGMPVLRELGRGAALGELALITGTPRSASVRAARDSELIAIDRPDFEELLRDAPELPIALARVLAEQLQESGGTARAVRPLPATVALVALDDAVPLGDIARRLASALERYTPTCRLDGRGTIVDADTPAAAYGPLLDRAEDAHGAVVLEAGSPFGGDSWTRFCLQQADRVLAIGSGGAVPTGADGRRLQGCDLVAWDVEQGSGALAEWTAMLDPLETHALRAAELDAGIARLARRLRGRSVAVVLSGGGARAFAHIGVLEGLVEAGVLIDRVAGVSMGALVGAMFAMGMDPEEIDARCYEEWVRRRPLGDFTLPRHGLIRGSRVRASLERTFGAVSIEELDRSFWCVSADLRSSEMVVHRHGPLVPAVGTSMALPVLGPPQVQGRRLLIDGSLIDNLPVGTMAAMGEGPIIAVDVKATFDRRVQGGTGALPDGRSRSDAAHEGEPPGLAETLTRVFLLASSKTSPAARRHADLVIAPRTDGVGLLEFHQLDRARAAGRAAARQALESAPANLFQ